MALSTCYNNAIVLLGGCDMSFSTDIKVIRQKSLLSQEAFAQALGVSFTTVNRWEGGKSKPSYKAMKLIDEFCKENNIDFDVSKEIIGGNEEWD